jgi:hypothetical protein
MASKKYQNLGGMKLFYSEPKLYQQWAEYFQYLGIEVACLCMN